MRCGPKSIAFTAVFLVLLVCVLYILFGDVSQSGTKFSFTAIFKNFSIQSFKNDNQATKDLQTTATTRKPTTTTQSEASRLLFKNEYDRIEKNLKGGLGADDIGFDTMQTDLGVDNTGFGVYIPHFDSQANNALQNIIYANNQHAKNVLTSHVVHPNNALQMFNALSNNIQSPLSNDNSLSHNRIQKLHVKYDNGAHYSPQNGKDLVNAHGSLQVDANQLIQSNAQVQTHPKQAQGTLGHILAGAQHVPGVPVHPLTNGNQMLEGHGMAQAGAQKEQVDSVHPLTNVNQMPDVKQNPVLNVNNVKMHNNV